MKTTRFLFVAISILQLQFSLAQASNADELKNRYSKYYEVPRENLFLHLNKTKFLQGEEIWFSGYVYDLKTLTPFKGTTNIYCGLYNSKGEQMTKEVFYAKDGMTIGQFEIKHEYGTGEFYVRAYTNYMKNFGLKGAYVQKINILDQSFQESVLNTEKDYEVQLMPESGHLLSGIVNTVGFKVMDQNGNGVQILNGRVLASNEKTILKNLSNNEYGIGKFDLEYLEKEEYSLIVTLPDGKSISQKIPKADELGVVFSINNLLDDKLAVLLKTNNKTLATIKGKNFHMAIHRDGLLALSTFSFEGADKSITFDREKLWPGVNILTLFDDHLTPICERLIFNSSAIKIGNITAKIQEENSSKDTVGIELNLFSKSMSPAHFSMSVLSAETLANNPSNNIISAFLLEPYIKNSIEEPSYYFKEIDRNKQYELDMLLLVQGWSSYDWGNIFRRPPLLGYAFENGFNISGHVENASERKNKMIIFDNYAHNQYFTEIDSTGIFDVPNALVYKDTLIQIVLFNKKGLPVKPDVAIELTGRMVKDTFNILNFMEIQTKAKTSLPQTLSEFETSENGKLIPLENVTVRADRRKKYSAINNSLYTGVKITDEKIAISGFIQRFGFRISKINANGEIDGKTHAYKMGSEAFVVVDGVVDLGFYDDSLTNVDQIYYDFIGGIFIVIPKQQKPYQALADYLLKEGFERPAKFYNPKYSSYNSRDYLEYGTVHWEPSLKIRSDGKGSIKFPNYGLEKIKLFIEGMAEDGTLVSEIKTIGLN